MFVSLQYGFHFPVPSFQNHCPRAHEKLGPSVSMSDDNEWFRKYFPLVTCKIGFVVVFGEVLLLDASDDSNAFQNLRRFVHILKSKHITNLNSLFQGMEHQTISFVEAFELPVFTFF